MKGVKYICPRGTSGYSEAAKDYIIGLYNNGIPITIEYMVFDETDYVTGERNEILNKLVGLDIEYDKVIIHSTPEHWEKYFVSEKKKNPKVEIIGMTVWETDKLDDRWVNWINQVDKVIVPCQFNKKVFIKCGITRKIYILPHIFHSINEKGIFSNIDKSDFIFYTIGQWSTRKGIDKTIQSYLNIFTQKDKVNLIVKTFKNDYSEKEKQKIKTRVNSIIDKYKNPAKITLILDECSDKQIEELHNTGDCYISLCKSEGWGLGAFVAAGLGKSVVITGFGGQKDYLKNYLIPYNLEPVKGMSWIPWYNDSQRWANPNINIASETLLQIKNNFETEGFKDLLKEQEKFIKRNFNSNFIACKLREILKN